MTDTDAQVGVRGLLGNMIQSQWSLGANTANIFWSDERRECQASVALIKVYPLGSQAVAKGLGYGYRQVDNRLTVDIKCRDNQSAWNALQEVLRILGHNRLSPFTGYDLIEFDDGTSHPANAGFYWWTVEVGIKQIRKPVST